MFKIFFLLLFNIQFVYSQFIQLAPDENIRNYYKMILNAEENVLVNNIDSALFYYCKAAENRTLFCTDAYNACLVATNINDYYSAANFASLLLQKGISPLYFESEPSFLNLVLSDHWKNMSTLNVTPMYNKDLHVYILDLLKMDQEYRGNHIYENKRIQVDFKIEKLIDSLFKKHGYLSEELIGVFQNDITIFPKGWSPFDIIMIHQNKLNPNKYKAFYEKSVLEGTMENKILAMHATNFGIDSNYLFKCFFSGIEDIMRVGDDLFTCGDELITLIDANRARILLPPLSYSIKAAAFKMKNTKFIIGSRPLEYADLNEKAEEKLRIDLKSKGYKQVYFNLLSSLKK